MNKNFNCEECRKVNVCKYTEIEVPEIISKVENKIDNEFCPEIIEFYVVCREFERKPACTTRDAVESLPKFPDWV